MAEQDPRTRLIEKLADVRVAMLTTSEADGGPVNCGAYTITSGWSDQFGPENGFTTLSVVKEETREIVWPAYTDKQGDGGEVVVPDQSYTPQVLP